MGLEANNLRGKRETFFLSTFDAQAHDAQKARTLAAIMESDLEIEFWAGVNWKHNMFFGQSLWSAVRPRGFWAAEVLCTG